MIEQNRIAYENSANFLPNWKTINKNELVNKYVEYEKKNKELAEHYLSAIICRYWHNIYKYYNKGSKLNPLEDYYEWVLEAILKCLNKKYWLNPKAKIYGDPNAPDKTINRAIKTTIYNYYEANRKDKRTLCYSNYSLDALKMEYLDKYVPEATDDKHNSDYFMHTIIRNAFNKKDYLLAFVVDAIIYENVIINDVLDYKKLIKHIHHLDNKFIQKFAEDYDIEIEKVDKSIHYCTKIPSDILKTKIIDVLLKIKREYYQDILC